MGDEVGASPRCVLAEILSPFSRAIQNGLNLNALYKKSPESADAELNEMIRLVEREIAIVLESKADGIFYRLACAEPEFATPMEYGGHYLEVDRALLGQAAGARMTVLCVEGGPEVYLDFVSDLPAKVFAWNLDRTGFTVDDVRKMRPGALATGSPKADVLFGSSYPLVKSLAQAAESVA